jgi:sec-independent protein translocase protein TatC
MASVPQDALAQDGERVPLLDHIIDLRRHLIRSFLAIGVAFCLCLYCAKPIFAFLVQPLLHAGQGKLIYTDIFEAFFAQMKVAFFSAIMLSFPIVANQLWRFVAPGLHDSERGALRPYLILTPLLFLMGAAMAYYVAMPLALHFLLGFKGNVGGVQQEALPAIGNYLDFVTKFMFGFGVAFLLPVPMLLLERAGIVSRAQFARGRRYAYVASFGLAAVLSPPDALSMMLLAVPLCLLYECALVAIWFSRRQRALNRPITAAP